MAITRKLVDRMQSGLAKLMPFTMRGKDGVGASRMRREPDINAFGGTWTQLSGLSPEARRAYESIRAGALRQDFASLRESLHDLLEDEMFTWPAFKAWHDFFKEKSQLPGSWDLQGEEPGLANREFSDEYRAFRSLAPKLRTFAASALVPESVEKVLRWHTLSEREFRKVVDGLRRAGVPVRILTGVAALEHASMQRLREVQRAHNLRGARSKSELCRIVRESLPEATLNASFTDEFIHVDVQKPEWVVARHGYLADVVRILAQTMHAESTQRRRSAEGGLRGHQLVEVFSAGDGLDPYCEALNGRRFPSKSPEAAVPHYPGCRCCVCP